MSFGGTFRAAAAWVDVDLGAVLPGEYVSSNEARMEGEVGVLPQSSYLLQTECSVVFVLGLARPHIVL